MPEYMNEDLSFLTFLVSPETFKYRIYIYTPIPMEDCEPYIYVSNGEKKECSFQDELIKITISGAVKTESDVNLSKEDLNKINIFIKENMDTIIKNWNNELSTCEIIKQHLIKWNW